MANMLSLDDFLEMLGRFGGDLASWPLAEAELRAVAVLLVQSPAAREAVADMRDLEAELRSELPRTPVGLADRILATAGATSAAAQPIQVRARSRRGAVH